MRPESGKQCASSPSRVEVLFSDWHGHPPVGEESGVHRDYDPRTGRGQSTLPAVPTLQSSVRHRLYPRESMEAPTRRSATVATRKPWQRCIPGGGPRS